VEFDCGVDPCELTHARITGSTGGLVDVRGNRPKPDTNGDYRWKYLSQRGVPREFVFNPGRNVVPEIYARVSIRRHGEYLYDYAVANAARAGQNVQSITVENVFPSRFVSAPPDWRLLQPSKVTPRGSWFTGGPGIQPGQEIVQLQLTSSRLPGPTQFTFRGDNRLIRLGPEDYPPPEIQDEINSLVDESKVIIYSLGPTIDRGIPPSDFVVNIRRTYRQAVLASTHPTRAAIADELDRLFDARSDVAELDAAIARLTRSLATPTGNHWDQELAAGLLMCIEHLSELNPQR
jgi:hypothetical protein